MFADIIIKPKQVEFIIHLMPEGTPADIVTMRDFIANVFNIDENGITFKDCVTQCACFQKRKGSTYKLYIRIVADNKPYEIDNTWIDTVTYYNPVTDSMEGLTPTGEDRTEDPADGKWYTSLELREAYNQYY